MKKIISLLSIVIISLCSSQMKAQITPYLEQITVNGSYISDCSTIAFGTNSSVNLSLKMRITKSATNDVGNFATFKLYILKNGSSSPQFINGILIDNSAFWNNGTLWEGVFSQTLQASDIDVSGSIFYGVYEVSAAIHPNTCNYSLTKTPPPSFSLSPTSISIPCGDSSQRTFTVTPANIPAGENVTYNWSHPSWTLVSTTATTRTLQPSSATTLPSNVTVTPYINNIPQPTLSCTVTRAQFTSSAVISGAGSVCTSSSYSIAGLQTGETVQWSLSNTTIASLSNSTSNSVTVNKIGNGTVDLIATITNSCNQTTTSFKSINIGAPSFSNTNMTGDNNPLTGETIWYSVQPPAGYTSLQWYFDNGGTTGTSINGWQILYGQGTSAISAKVGNPGLTYVVCKAFNSCSNAIKYVPVTVRSITDPCDSFKINIKNPIKESDNLTGKIVPPPTDPCDDLYAKIIDKKEPKKIQVFDFLGRIIFSGEFVEDNFDLKLEKLTKGNYLLNIILQDGKIQHETIIVE